MGFEVKRMALLVAYKNDPHILLVAVSGKYFEHICKNRLNFLTRADDKSTQS
jgi:hypothetical protein